MFRIILITACIALAFFLYDAYGYRYYLSDIRAESDNAMSFGDTIDADISIVAYMDYGAPSSRRLYPLLLNLAAADDDVKVTIRPVSAGTAFSDLVTRVAIAAKNQGRFMDFNNVILSRSSDIDEDFIEGAVMSLNMDYDQVKFDMISTPVEQEVQQYQREMALLNIPSLPYFYIEHVKMEGAAYTVKELRQIISDLRTGRR
jgi:protein-disulfide isomerase